ncbi:PKD domain-containing protein [Saccharothrix variisporea]|uniref:PKD/Chitinase domain-containing protein n=1 Tax=Saccharothrix variisporea TaxID=543527 RepID=A0A495X8X1_9PSEU|nr:PKD domain-containing protein [Saccharothrix variisporea]RKT69314.1 hypothetical protein DFJ66_2523 [Saccharothrix variisporea]
MKVTGCDGCGGEPGPTPPGNTPPTVDAGPDVSGNEGASIALNGSVTDPDDSPAISWTYQLGPDVDAGTTCQFGDVHNPGTTITCTDDGTITVTLTANDGHGEPAPVSDSATVTLANVAPTSAITSPTSGQLFKARQPVPVTVTFTDAGTNDRHTCSLTFGDGSPAVTGTVTESGGSGTCTASHTYGFDGLGPRTVQATVTDDDGGKATAAVDLVIYVPGHGFALEATGLIPVARTPDVHCPPNDSRSQAVLDTGVGRIDGLSVSCTLDPKSGRTVVNTAITGASLLAGLVKISDVESACAAGAEGIDRSSRVGTINGIPIGTGSGVLQIPGVASVYYNETSANANGDLVQNAVRVVTPVQEIVLANCRLG